MQQAIHIPGSGWCHPQPAYPLKSPELTTSELDLQKGYQSKAWYKILKVAQSISKIALKDQPKLSVEDLVHWLLSEEKGLKKLVVQKLLEEKSSLQKRINEIQDWQNCAQFFKNATISGPRFEQESIDRCLKILESLEIVNEG